MNIGIILTILARRRQLHRRDRWTHTEIQRYQAESLQALRGHAYAHSPFYREFHKDLYDRPLAELPVLTKKIVMENFDRIVTDRSVRLADLEAHLTGSRAGERFGDRYWVNGTSGSTGRRGIFLFNRDEWCSVLTSYARVYDWAGVGAGLMHRVKMAVVSSTSSLHQSAQVGSTVHSPWVPTLRVDSTWPIPEIVVKLNRWQPEVLVAYASMARILAGEQLAGRLLIVPATVITASEVLTDATRSLLADAWGSVPYNTYGATETAGIASECSEHRGLHLFEDLVITEAVDEHNRSVPFGTFSEKILTTVLFSRTLPLIRYEISDSIMLADRRCPCGRAFGLIEAIQGRVEDVLHFTGERGHEVAVHPNVFHQVMDSVGSSGWQIVQEPGRLDILISGAPGTFSHDDLVGALRHALRGQGVPELPIVVHLVDAIPRGPMGKAPLVKAYRGAGHTA